MTVAFDLNGVDGWRLRDMGFGVRGGDERSIGSVKAIFG
jgi:hypothetical protein